MQTKAKKLISTLLTLAMLVSLITTMPLTAGAAHDNSTIDLSQLGGQDVPTGTYTNWSYVNSTNTITLTGNVTIVGTRAREINDSMLKIENDTHVVTWEANYLGSLANQVLVHTAGWGSFVMRDGRIENSASNAHALYAYGNVSVYNGTISATDGAALATLAYHYNTDPDAAGDVYIFGGTISATTGTAILTTSQNSTVDINGGTISATSGNAIRNMEYVNADENTSVVIIRDGNVSATMGNAINYLYTPVNSYAASIVGGTVSSTNGGSTIGTTGIVHLGGGTVTANATVAIVANGVYVTDYTGTKTSTVSNDGGENPAISLGRGAGQFGGVLRTYEGVSNLIVNGDVMLMGDDAGISAGMSGSITINGNVLVEGDNSNIGASDVRSAQNVPGVLTVNGNVVARGVSNSIFSVSGEVYITGSVSGIDNVILSDAGVEYFEPVSIPFGSPTRADVVLPSPFNGFYWADYTISPTVGNQPHVYIKQGVIGEDDPDDDPDDDDEDDEDDEDDTPPLETIPGGDGSVLIPYTITNGIATLELPSDTVDEIIEKSRGGKATLDLSDVSGATGATMPKAALTQLSGAGLAMEVKFPQGTVSLNAASAASVATRANGEEVTISLSRVNQSTLTEAQRAAIDPDDLVFNISIMSGTQSITSFDGAITVTVPYSGELPVVVWYLSAAGELEELDCFYDTSSNIVIFTINHLSLYVVGPDREQDTETEEPDILENPFVDVREIDWFFDDVLYAYSIGLIAGTSATTFSPNNNLTYAEAVTLAARMHQFYMTGEVTLENGADLWYQSYVGYALMNGIISSNDNYDWDAEATRAGYMQIFANALPNDALAAINSVTNGSIPDVPMDYPGAAAIYKLYRAGILQGNDDAHTCNPNASILRCEVAAILTRMMNPNARIEFSM